MIQKIEKYGSTVSRLDNAENVIPSPETWKSFLQSQTDSRDQ
jgi:hypothetical protein